MGICSVICSSVSMRQGEKKGDLGSVDADKNSRIFIYILALSLEACFVNFSL
jgi:hypothetical protein